MALPDLKEIEKIKEEFVATQTQPNASTEKVKSEEKVVTSPTDKVADAPTGENKDVVQQPSVELTDDEILALAEKRGMKVSRETLTPEQQKKQADIEEAQKLQFAIEQNLITPEGYQEAKAILNAEGNDLTKKEFSKIYKEENKGATKEEIDDAFDDYYFVQKNVTVKDKRLKKNEDTLESELEEFTEEKPKWDDKVLKLGELRRNRDAQNIKNGAKQVLDNIDSSYANWKITNTRASDYSKNIQKVISETDFSSYPTAHKIGKKEISATVKFEKPDEVKKEVINHLANEVSAWFIGNEKHTDVAEIKKQVDRFVRNKYAEKIEETLWDLAKTEGMNEAKVGSSSPIERELVSDDSNVDEVLKQVEARIPKLPPKTEKSKR